MGDLPQNRSQTAENALPLPEAQTQIFFIQNSGKLAALPEEKLPHGGVFCQADRAVIGVRSFTRLPESLQEVSTHGPIRLVAGDIVQSDRIQNRDCLFRSVRFCNHGGVSRSSTERRRYPEQLFVEQHDRRPVGPAAARTLRMYGLNGSFELKSPDSAGLKSLGQMTLRLFH